MSSSPPSLRELPMASRLSPQPPLVVNRSSDWRPTPDQRLLLEAALARDASAGEAWRAWRRGKDPREHRWDAGSYRLLPAVYKNLSAHGLDDPFMGELRNVYQQSWFRNQALLGKLARVIDLLGAAGHETIVLKGAALVLRHHLGEVGVRPMEDVDVLVRTERADDAWRLMVERGWRPAGLVASYPSHARVLIDDDGIACDLHRHVLRESGGPARDRVYWAGARPLSCLGRKTLALNPTDHLTHVCTHGARWNYATASLRWIVDALTILREDGAAIDWARLIEHARRDRPVAFALGFTLPYLRGEFGAGVPDEVIDGLARMEFTRVERRRWLRRMRSAAAMGPLERARFLVTDYRFVAPRGGPWRKLSGFVRYLQCVLRVESPGQIPRRVLSGAMRQMAARR